MKGLLTKILGIAKNLIDIDHDGKIEASDVFRIVAKLAPLLSSDLIGEVKSEIIRIAGAGQIVDPDGGVWTPAQASKAFDGMIEAAQEFRAKIADDNAMVKAVMDAQQAGG